MNDDHPTDSRVDLSRMFDGLASEGASAFVEKLSPEDRRALADALESEGKPGEVLPFDPAKRSTSGADKVRAAQTPAKGGAGHVHIDASEIIDRMIGSFIEEQKRAAATLRGVTFEVSAVELAELLQGAAARCERAAVELPEELQGPARVEVATRLEAKALALAYQAAHVVVGGTYRLSAQELAQYFEPAIEVVRPRPLYFNPGIDG